MTIDDLMEKKGSDNRHIHKHTQTYVHAYIIQFMNVLSEIVL